MRTFQTLERATSLAPSRPTRLERVACQRRRVGVQGRRVRAAAREQLWSSLRRTCTLTSSGDDPPLVRLHGRIVVATSRRWRQLTVCATSTSPVCPSSSPVCRSSSPVCGEPTLQSVFTPLQSGITKLGKSASGSTGSTCLDRPYRRDPNPTSSPDGQGAAAAQRIRHGRKVAAGRRILCISTARRVLCCARSSVVRPVRQCRGRPAVKQCGVDADAHPPLPESTLGTPDDANDTEGVHSVAHSNRQ